MIKECITEMKSECDSDNESESSLLMLDENEKFCTTVASSNQSSNKSVYHFEIKDYNNVLNLSKHNHSSSDAKLGIINLELLEAKLRSS